MLNGSLFPHSFNDLRNIFLNDLTIFNVALVYVLMYVIYRTLGRYIYFKPEEHSSKINRTFLTLSLLVVLLNTSWGITEYLPFLPQHRWLYALCVLIILIAPLSILMDRVIWRYDIYGHKSRRNWHYDYLPIPKDYYKTNISKDKTEGNMTTSWEEEGVESTTKNIHSDALLNIFALIVFITICVEWARESAIDYGRLSYIFSIVTSLTIAGIFLDSAVFSWIKYLERKVRALFKH